MRALLRSLFALTLSTLVLTPQALAPTAMAAERTERRFGLVIGNAEYPSGTLPTAANDAGLIAQTLQAAGFDVIGARDLDGDSLRRTFRDFADKVAGAGPDAVAVVYLNGHGLQYEGDNYFAGVDAKIDRDVDVPSHALRVNDFLRPLASLKPKALIVVMDTARENPYARNGNPLAGGMALVEPTPGTLFAFNASPGTIAKTDTEAYGVYAQSLAEMIREGGLPINTLFDRVRLRVNEASEGASLPWHASKLEVPFEFFERAEDAPKPEASHQVHSTRRSKPIKAFDEAQEAYFAALERDSLSGYVEFLDAYPDHRLSKRVQAIIASRREATTWRRSRNADTPNAYWTYLDVYPDGPHAWDARRRLDFLTAPPLPPPTYTRFIYDDLPPPYEYEYTYVRRRSVFWFYDPVFAFAPPPPCPIFFLPPPLPRLFFRPPPPPIFAYVLPVPVYVPVQTFVRPVRTVIPPPNNIIAVNIHQTITQPPPGPVTGTPGPAVVPGVPVVSLPPVPGAPGSPPTGAPSGPGGIGVATAVGAGVVAGAAAAAIASRVALPASLASKAVAIPPKPAGTVTPVSTGPVLQPGQGRPQPGTLTGPIPPGARPGVPPIATAPTSQGTTPGGQPGGPSILQPKQATGTPPPGPGAGTPPAQPSILQPKQATGTPPPPAVATPPVAARDTAAADRARAEQQRGQQAQQAEQQRAKDAQRTQQEARDRQQQSQQQSQQRAQEAQRAQAQQQAQRQQIRDRQQQEQQQQQRRSEQQRQQQQQQQQAASQQAQAQARAAQQAQAQARAAQQAQAQARAAQQAQAQAAQARAAQAAAQQRQAAQAKPRCGIPGTPACPR